MILYDIVLFIQYSDKYEFKNMNSTVLLIYMNRVKYSAVSISNTCLAKVHKGWIKLRKS